MPVAPSQTLALEACQVKKVHEEKLVTDSKHSQTFRARSLMLLACMTSLACAGCGPAPPTPPEPKPSQAMPMNVIFFEEDQIVPTVDVRLHTDDGGLTEPQTLLVDTGSSSMAFCDSSLAASVLASRIPYLWCQRYGSTAAPAAGANGWVHEATMDVESFKNKKGLFSVMENHYEMPCSSQVRGIFGVAYKTGNAAWKFDQVTPLPKWNMTKVKKQGAPKCPNKDLKEALPYSNLQKWLSDDGTENSRFGIYWSGKLGAAEASLYYGDAAVANPHYDSRMAQKAKMTNLLGFGSYSVEVTSFTLRTGNDSFTFDLMNFGPAGSARNQSLCALSGGWCILDTGTGSLQLFPEFASEDWIAKNPKVAQPGAATALAKAADVCNSLPSQATGSIEFELAPPSGAREPAKLSYDFAKLCPAFSAKNLTGMSWGGYIGFGWPTWLQHYIVFDISDNSATIVPLHRPSMRGTSPIR